MSIPTPLMPRKPVPALSVPTVEGSTWTLNEVAPENFTMIVFYRGYHCPVCAKYLRELVRQSEEFERRGVAVIAISTDGEERARQARDGWHLGDLRVGYGLNLDDARKWGLYISKGIGKTSIGIEEPSLFNEPAVYIVRSDGSLYYGSVQTMPFARPDFSQLLGAIDKALEKNYPARGEVVDHRLEGTAAD